FEVLSFAELRQLVGDDRPRPQGLIVHTGRCGSTLLTRMLVHDRATLVAAEPVCVGLLHRDAMSEPARRDDDVRALADLLVLFDRFAEGRGQRPVFKFTSWQAADAGTIF